MISGLWLIPTLPFAKRCVAYLVRLAFVAPGSGGGGRGISRRRGIDYNSHRVQFLERSSHRQRVHTGSLDVDPGRGLPSADRFVSRCALPGDDPGRHVRRLPHSRLLGRVHGRGPRLQPVLRLHESVCSVDDHTAAGEQSLASLTRVGRRGIVQLSADRLLVSRSRRTAGRRARRSS